MTQFWVGFVAGTIFSALIVLLFIRFARWKAKRINSSELRSYLDIYYKSIGIMDEPIDKWSEHRAKEKDD